ncbi:UDP-N-acetylmuramyl peptide synthase [Chromatium weissei]|nr:UDP-N-acetylmuramyl peptide synthase [Chromatium weissei]
MSEISLIQILTEVNAEWRQQPVTLPTLTNMQWRADACDANSVLFFQCFDGGPSDAEIYQRYLQSSRCAALVTNRQLACFDQLPNTLIVVIAPADWAQVIGRCCDVCYPLATERLHFIGVTGTNGKTTTVKYVEAILLAHGQRVLSVGTLGLFLNGQRQLETGFTSPPQIELRRLLHEYQTHCDVVVMEISSHALDQGRVYGIPLRAAGWTNFTQDHLDYHHDEAHYFAAKSLILNLIQFDGRLYCSSAAVANRLLAQQSTVPIELVSPQQLSSAAIAAKPFLALEHNRHNYALAIALVNCLLGENERDDWQYLIAVDGRFECQTFGNHTIVIDFAHTPDALETILIAIRNGFPTARIATVFGCGGDRDRSKRPLMGAAVARHSDICIVTSDNPRTEDPAQIIADILIGIPSDAIEKRTVVIERAEAIAQILNWLAQRPITEFWVVLIAGKGHERYIDRNGHKTPYSDQDEVARHLARLSCTQ